MLDTQLAQPKPEVNDFPYLKDLVIHDMESRADGGKTKYGTYLQPHNGRIALIDAYQDALDLVIYLRQLIYEQFGE